MATLCPSPTPFINDTLLTNATGLTTTTTMMTTSTPVVQVQTPRRHAQATASTASSPVRTMTLFGAQDETPLKPTVASPARSTTTVAAASPLEQYDILNKVGEGSFGVVHRCRLKATEAGDGKLSHLVGRYLAIKKFRTEGQDDIALREIKMLKRVSGHPNIIKVHEVFRRRGRLYMVMDYVEYTLMDLLEGKHRIRSNEETTGQALQGISLKKSRRIMAHLLQALAHVHHLGLIHRDIKPENILCSADGHVVKLCDFGLSRPSAVRPFQLNTPTKAPFTDYVATRWYRSPELLLGATMYDTTIDIWACACLWVEMLTGKPLFPGDGEIEMLQHFLQTLGPMPALYHSMFSKSATYKGLMLPPTTFEGLERRLKNAFGLEGAMADVVLQCCQWMPEDRPSATTLLSHPFLGQYAHPIPSVTAPSVEQSTPLLIKSNSPMSATLAASAAVLAGAETAGKPQAKAVLPTPPVRKTPSRSYLVRRRTSKETIAKKLLAETQLAAKKMDASFVHTSDKRFASLQNAHAELLMMTPRKDISLDLLPNATVTTRQTRGSFVLPPIHQTSVFQQRQMR